MYIMTVVTEIGNYIVEADGYIEDVVDGLIKGCTNLVNDITAGCFMEGWVPGEDPRTQPPGLWAMGKDAKILGYHVERLKEEPPVMPVETTEYRVAPRTLVFDYLGVKTTAHCIEKVIDGVRVIYCYSVNGEPPTDVMAEDKVRNFLIYDCINNEGMEEDEFMVYVASDGRPRNFSQAVEELELIEQNIDIVKTARNAKAWTGWKGGDE